MIDRIINMKSSDHIRIIMITKSNLTYSFSNLERFLSNITQTRIKLRKYPTSITAFSIKFVTGVFDGLVSLSSVLPRVIPAANSRLV